MAGMSSRPVQQRVIFEQPTPPSTVSSVVWIDTSGDQPQAKIYDPGADEWLSVGVVDYNNLVNTPTKTEARTYSGGFGNSKSAGSGQVYDTQTPVTISISPDTSLPVDMVDLQVSLDSFGGDLELISVGDVYAEIGGVGSVKVATIDTTANSVPYTYVNGSFNHEVGPVESYSVTVANDDNNAAEFSMDIVPHRVTLPDHDHEIQ